MNTTTRLGLSIITSGLAFVGSANAVDLIVNGSFEEDASVGWTGYFKTYNYTAAYFTGPPIPEAEEPGTRYSWRHGAAEGQYNAPCVQTVDLTAGVSVTDIDAGLGQFTFSAWLAGYGKPGSNPEKPYVTLQFFDGTSAQVGATVALDRVLPGGFVTFADGVTTFDDTTHLYDWAKYVRTSVIPPSARTATVGITRSPNAGLSGTPDSYTDLVKLDVTVSAVIPPPTIGEAAGNASGFVLDISEGSVPLDASSITLKLDGANITPTSVVKNGQVTKVTYRLPAGTYFASGSSHTVAITAKDSQGRLASETRGFNVASYIAVPASAKTQADTSKPGFVWRVHQNNALQSNDNERPELQLAGKLIDTATGLPYENTASPDAVGSANGPAAPADPSYAPLRFEIETVINMSQTAGENNGNFRPDDGMPGIPNDLQGIAGEIMTYLDLPAGIITMGVNSDDGFLTKTGVPLDAFKSVTVGEFNGGRGAADTLFSILITEPGIYAFRTVWEEGSGGANIEWFSIKEDGTRVLINDIANGGIPAYRETVGGFKPYVRSVSPGPGKRQLNAVSSKLIVELADGSSETINDASASLKLNGQPIAVDAQREGGVLTLTYDPAGLLIPSDIHSAELSFTGSAGTARSESWSFRNLKKIVLPAPTILEDFNSYPEDSQPEGWMAWNFTAKNGLERDIRNQQSASFEDWVLIDVGNISSIDGGRPFQITPGQMVTIDGTTVELRHANPPEGGFPEWLASGNVLYAESDSRNNTDSQGGPNNGQTQFITTKPYDLSSFGSVVITFSSIYEQNQDSLGAVEYSVDGGSSWLPVMYFLEAPDIKLNDDGSVDAVRTFRDTNADTSSWVDNGVAKGDNYGDGIAAPITAALGDFIVPRINDGQVEGKRMEVARLSQAAGKSDVRLRLASLGTDSWYFAIDNLAFYDLGGGVVAPTLSIAGSGASVVITFQGSLLEASSLNGPWTPVAGNSPLTINNVSGTKFYRAVR